MMVAGPPGPLALLFVLFASPQEEYPPLPRRYAWGFETTDPSGNEIFAMEEVPIFIGGRPTQPDWVQEFGARADPAHRDRFPREPRAAFSRGAAHSGTRSLHLMSRGDHALVHLSRGVRVVGGIAFRLRAQVRPAHLKEGRLKLRAHFTGAGLEGEPPAGMRMESPPVGGEGDWRALELSGQVPEGSEVLDVEILLEGSYRDGETEAWIDSLELLLEPGLRVDWPGQGLLLFAGNGPEIPLGLEARGLTPGPYVVEATLARRPSGPGSPSFSAPPFTARRYVSSPAVGTSLSGDALRAPSGANAGLLRFRGELRQMFQCASVPGGLYLFTLSVKGPLGQGVPEKEVPKVEHVERLGFLPESVSKNQPPSALRRPSGAEEGEAACRGRRGGGSASPTNKEAQSLSNSCSGSELTAALEPLGLHLGWAIGDDELERGGLDVLRSLPKGFPLHQLLWEIPPAARPRSALLLPPAINLAGEQAHLPLRGRVGIDLLLDPGAPALFKEWRPLVRSFSVAGGTDAPEVHEALKAIQKEAGAIVFGSNATPAASWAKFRETELDAEGLLRQGPLPLKGIPPPGPSDWALAALPPASGERQDFLTLAALLIEEARSGYRHAYLRGLADVLGERSPCGHRGPRLAAFAWAVLGSHLARGPARDLSSWDARGRFLVVEEGAETILIAMASGGEQFLLERWTGGPLRGETLLGDSVPVELDAETLRSTIPVGPEPAIFRGLNLALADTAESLVISESALTPARRWQELSMRMVNRTRNPMTIAIRLRLSAGWRVEGERLERVPAPGEESNWTFRAFPPDDFRGDGVEAALEIEIDRGGRQCRWKRVETFPVHSPSLRISRVSLDPASRKLGFTIENLSARAYLARAYCRVALPSGRDLLETWDEWIPGGGRRALTLPLGAPDDLLDGKEVWIGVDVDGQDISVVEHHAIEKGDAKGDGKRDVLRLIRK